MTTAAVGAVSASAVNEERLAWLALALTPQLGPRRILRAIERIGGAGKIFDLRLTDLEGLQFPAESAQFIADGQARSTAYQQLDELVKTGGSFLTYADADYPERLREIFDPPPLLWLRGMRSCCGSRRLRWWGRGTRHLMDQAWRRCCRGIWRSAGC